MCVFLLSISAASVSAHTIGCGIVLGKEYKLLKPKRPSNLAGTVEVKVKIDQNGNVYSAESLSENAELRRRSLEQAVKLKYRPSTINSAPVFAIGKLKYIFTTGKSKAEVFGEYSLDEEYKRFVDSSLVCSSLSDKISDYINQKIKSVITGEKPNIKNLEIIIKSKKNDTEFVNKLKDFGVKIISDDTNYFSGIYGEITIDKVLDLDELDFVENVFGLSDLDVCEYKLYEYEKLKRQECSEFKNSSDFIKIFYGNQTDKIISPKKSLPESLKNSDKKVFVQIKFDADGNVLEAKSVSGNAELFSEAETFVRQLKLKSQEVNGDLKYSVGLIVYDAELFKKQI